MSKIKDIISKINLSKKTKIVLGALVGAITLNFIVGQLTGVSILTAIKNLINGELKEVKMVTIESSGYKNNEPGSWHIEKSAEWTGENKAQVVFNVDTVARFKEVKNYDVVMVIDVSTSMEGEKIKSLKTSAKKYIQEILANQNNRIAIVEYHTTSDIITGFSNNANNLSTAIDNLTLKCQGEVIDGVVQSWGYCTNYYAGLKKTEEVLKNYTPSKDRQLVVLLLTDGSANRDNALIKPQYSLLKSKYPDMVINGIQYEMGSSIQYYLKEASDYQYDAYVDDIYNKFFNATYSSVLESYESFEVVDYVDGEYFEVVSQNDIKVSLGTVKLTTENGKQKITWTVGSEQLKTGYSMKMEINLKLKAKHVEETEGFYPTNEKEEISSKLPGESKKTTTSNETPVLQRGYKVIYDPNYPSGCNINWSKTEPHYVYQTVEISGPPTACDGYIFHGWEITDKVTMVNDDYFIMPFNDVHIKGKWGKVGIAKSMDGTVWQGINLYETIELEVQKTDGKAKKYTGNVTDTLGTNANKNVYYYTSDAVNNNVIFGGFCWKIVRTTTTGGVKILYNGTPSSGKCTATGEAATIGKSAFNTDYNSPAYVGYMYNKVYAYNSGVAPSGSKFGANVSYANGTYTLTGGTITSTTPDDTHHYTCATSGTTCTKVRYYFSSQLNLATPSYYYIELNGAANIQAALTEMLSASNVNSKDSTIKKYIEDWYKTNLEKYKSSLEDTVFCYDRSISSLEGWNPSGSLSNSSLSLGTVSDLSCPNATDKFTTSNSSAQLKYPIGLLTTSETYLLNVNGNTLGIGTLYWKGSPHKFGFSVSQTSIPYSAHVSIVSIAQAVGDYGFVSNGLLVRPVVSLKPDTKYTEGDGTSNNPFVITTS